MHAGAGVLLKHRLRLAVTAPSYRSLLYCSKCGAYAIKPDLPYTPGGDAAGVVAEIGHDVTEFAIGDAVFVGVAMGFDMTGCR